MEEDEFPIGLKIVVVDDDETCLFILERMLQSLNYQGTSISFFISPSLFESNLALL